MSNSGDLLRMLEPAVRPVATPAPQSTRPKDTPFETKSFDALLSEAQTHSVTEPNVDEPGKTKPTDLLSPLTHVDAIQNASLRQIVRLPLPPGEG